MTVAVSIYCFTVILQICADNLLICSETAAALLQPCPRQLLISNSKLINPTKIASANGLPENPKQQCRKPKNSFLMTQSMSTSLITRDASS